MAVLTTFLALAVALPACVAGRVPCYAGVKIILAPAHGVNNPGYQQNLVNNVTTAIPGSFVHSVPYDSSGNYSYGVADGAAKMKSEVKTYLKYCPTSPVVLMGYSEGGIVVMNTLCGNFSEQGQIHTNKARNVIAAISYAEETFVPGQSYDLGTCTTGPSTNPRPDPATCNVYAPIIQSYCDAPDPACCHGNDTAAHFEYSHYDYNATDFIVAKYNAFRQGQQG